MQFEMADVGKECLRIEGKTVKNGSKHINIPTYITALSYVIYSVSHCSG